MKEAQRLRLLPALPRQGVGVCTGPDFKKEKTKIKGLISLSVSFSSQQLSIHFIAFAYNAPKCDVLHTSRADVAVQCTAGRIGALEGGAHVSTEARVSSRDHARGAFDAHEGCAKASKHCNCDNRASDFPADDAGSVLRRSVTTYAAANALSLSPPPGGGGEGGGAVVVALPTALFFSPALWLPGLSRSRSCGQNSIEATPPTATPSRSRPHEGKRSTARYATPKPVASA